MEVVQAVQAKHSVSNDEPELDHTLNTKATPAPLTSAITPAQMDELKHSSPLSDSFTEVMPSAFPSFFSASVPSLPTIESSVFSDPSPIYGTMPQQQASKQLDNQSVVSDNLGRQGSLEGGPQMFAINNAPDEAGNLSDSSAQSVPDDRVSSSTPAVLISGNGDREVPQSENHHDPVQVPPAGDGLVVPAQSSADQAARDANSTSHGPSSVDHSPRAAASSSISNVPVGADDPSTGLDPVLPGQALPRSRLAHDIVGILEDRIREDPKGDLAAWKGLILEHERRERLEEARAVFERFLKLVPTAVSCIPSQDKPND